jgi:P4 family phage/plasmid primase-like protien
MIKVRTCLKSAKVEQLSVEYITEKIKLSLDGNFSKATLFEVIDGACRAYIDYDMELKDCVSKEHLIETRNNMIKQVREILKDHEIVVVDGSRVKKEKYFVSLHIIFQNRFFRSGLGVLKFVEQFYDKIPFDRSVYKAAGKMQLMRLPYCGKTDEDLKFMKIYGKKAGKKFDAVTLEQYKQCCITLIPEDAILEGEEVVINDVDSKTDPQDDEETWAFLEKFQKLMPNTQIIGRGLKEKDTQIIDLKKSTDKCPMAGRVHKHNRNYIVHNIKKDTYILKCFDQDCEGKFKKLTSAKPFIAEVEVPTTDDHFTDGLMKLTFDTLIQGDFNENCLAKLFMSAFANEKQDLKIVDSFGNGYLWNGLRWKYYPHITLIALIGNSFESAVRNVHKYLEIKIDEAEGAEKSYYTLLKKNVTNSYKKLNSKTGMKNIFELAKIENGPLFMKHNIFDENSDLIGFENGVYDLSVGIFRPYGKSDFVTMSTGYDYRPAQSSEVKIWKDFISQIMPIECERKFLLKVLSTTLYGRTIENLFLLIGNGRNSKDTLITSILNNILGPDYYYKAPSALLTSTFKQGASPEIHNMNKKRCVVITEPDKKTTWKCANIKELTGASAINARTLYQTQTETKIHATIMVLQNSVPMADDMDNALASRIQGIPFRAQFLSDEKLNEVPEDTPYVYKCDARFKSQQFIESVKYAALQDLLQEFKTFDSEGRVINNVPDSIKEITREYIENCDEFLQWFKENYEYVDDEDTFIPFNELYDTFKRSELFANSNKTDKRRLTKQKMIKDILDNPNIRPFYRERRKIRGKDYRNIILKHKAVKQERENCSSDDES